MLIFILGFGALFVSLGFYVDSLDTVFPNVWADGINVSGLTRDEVEQTLINEGYEQNAEGISVTLIFPDNSKFSVTGEEVGLSLNASEAASKAFEFGRNESFFRNEITYIRALFNRTDLNDLSSPNYDDSIIRQLAGEYTLQFNRTLLDSNIERTNEGITIVKGTGLNQADENEVYNLARTTLLQAVEEHENLTVNYTPEATSDDGIDLNILFESIHVDAVTSVWDIATLSATASSEGRTFDLEEAEAKLRSATGGQAIFIPIYTLYPDVTQEEIEALLFAHELATVTTRMTNIANRIRNITIASESIDGHVLNPGDVFSFNQVVGRRTRERGFLEANGIIGGRLEPVTGGGICQVTSTMYAALLRTQITIKERNDSGFERTPHGLTVSYLPYGEDATVSYGNLDFKFTNTTDFPLRIDIKVEGRDITVSLWGTNRYGEYTEVEMGDPRITPFVVEERDSEDHYIGETEVFTPGQQGVRVVTYRRIFNAEGELLSEQTITSNYRVQNRIILKGTAERPPAPPPPDIWDIPPSDGGHESPNDDAEG